MIEPPSQLVAAFDDHLLRTYLFSRQDKVIQRRIDNWLAVFLDSQLQAEEDGEEASKNMQDVLNGLLSYVTYTKVSNTPMMWTRLSRSRSCHPRSGHSCEGTLKVGMARAIKQ